MVIDRTAKANQTRGLSAEYGIVLPRGIARLKKEMPRILEDASNGLTPFSRELFLDLYRQLLDVDDRVKDYDRRILKVFNQSPACRRLAAVPGVGPLTATGWLPASGALPTLKMEDSWPPGWGWYPDSTPAVTIEG